MRIANRPLNYQAIALEEAETELRLLVKDDFLKRIDRRKTDSKAREIINKALERIKIPSLKIVAKQSLISFYLRQQSEINRINGKNLLVLLSLMRLSQENKKIPEVQSIVKTISVAKAKSVVKEAIKTHNITHGTTYDMSKTYGLPLQKFHEDYINKNVKPVLDGLSKMYALDPDDIEGRNSLRNKAEMEVRYQSHLDNIGELKEQGHRLVIASEHADCSERCRPYQGRVYSLDKTSGVTPDGREYVPLEYATKNPRDMTRRGDYNGLLGYNCRHYLVPYKDGFRFPKPNPIIEAKEYKITQTQRYLERQVRHWRTEAIMRKGTDPTGYIVARKKVMDYNAKYIKYSRENGRAYYPSRTKLI